MEAGICPNCKSDNIEYGDSEMICGQLKYNATCNDCGTTFIEWYDVTFVNITNAEIMSDIRKEANENT